MPATKLAAADIIVILIYLGVVVGKGVLLSRKQQSVEDYFLAGRSMSYWVVSISIIASLLSAITYMGAPTEAYQHDLKFSLILFCIPLVAPIVIGLFLPFFYKLNLYTAYEYLEIRFSVPVRTVASLFFIFWRMGWMALVIFAPSLAISTFFNIDWRYCALLVGVAATAYTVLGGMTAVMWTDVIQFFVLYGGAFLVMIVAILRTDGGTGYLWQAALENGKLTTIDFKWDPTQRISTWAIILGGTVGMLAAYATDQVAIQRYLTTKSYEESRRSLIFHAIIIVPASIIFYWMGTILWGFYHQQPGLLVGFDAEHPDRILPFFIAHQLPVGVRGALIAALFAATMSSIDSGINSITTTTIVDFYGGVLKRTYDRAAHLLLARIWTVIWGVIVTGAAIAAGMWGSTLLEMSNKVSGLFCGPLLGIFLLGMLTKRANWQGALIGAAIGFGAALLTAFGGPLSAVLDPRSMLHAVSAKMGEVTFLYYPTIGCGLTLAFGILFSLLFAPPRPEQVAGPEELARSTEDEGEAAPSG
jgi:SSS family transporter